MDKVTSEHEVHEHRLQNIKKVSVIELQEILQRQKDLLNNSSLIRKLPDKGESIRKLYEGIQKELKCREDMEILEKSVQNLSIKQSSTKFEEKHIQKLCEFEKTPEREQFKPYLTLVHQNYYKEHTTRLIPLEQSIDLLKSQEDRTKESEMQIKQERLLSQEDENDADSDSGVEKFDLSDNSDTEDKV